MEFRRKEKIVDEAYQFTTAGETFAGQYVKPDETKYGDKIQKDFMFRSPEGVPTRIKGTAVVSRLMKQIRVGDWVEFVYLGESPIPGTDNKLKLFELHRLEVIASGRPGQGREPGDEL